MAVNVVAPSKVVQVKNDYLPYIDKEIKSDLRANEAILEDAITTKNQTKFIEHRQNSYKINKKIKQNKTKYFIKRLKGRRDKFRVVLELNKSNKTQTP